MQDKGNKEQEYPLFVVGVEERIWQRRSNEESKEAYAAFAIYYRLPPRQRSINEAWRVLKGCQEGVRFRAPGNWQRWSVRYAWLQRSAAYDAYLAEQDADLWEERRKEIREQDWEQGDALRVLFDDSLPAARLFVRSSTRVERGYPTLLDADGKVVRQGRADRQFITTTFSLVDWVRMLVEASKLQRLAADEPTTNMRLSGAALDAAILFGLENLANPGGPF